MAKSWLLDKVVRRLVSRARADCVEKLDETPRTAEGAERLPLKRAFCKPRL